MEVITSKENKKVKQLRLLSEKNAERKRTGSFIAEGVKMVKEAFTYAEILELYLSESFYLGLREETFTSMMEEHRFLKEKLSSCQTVYILSDSVFKILSDTVTPQGVLARVKMPIYRPTDPSFLDEAYRKDGAVRLLLLEDIKDPGNLGTLVRTAEAAGITGIIMSKGTADLFNPKTVRSTMGSVFRVPTCYTEDLFSEIKELKKRGILFYAAHLKGKIDYKELSYGRKAGILIGNEARGLSDEISKLADCYIRIPMKGQVESLNAAVAASLIMYEL